MFHDPLLCTFFCSLKDSLCCRPFYDIHCSGSQASRGASWCTPFHPLISAFFLHTILSDTVKTCRNSEQTYQIFIRSIMISWSGRQAPFKNHQRSNHMQHIAASCCIIRVTFACRLPKTCPALTCRMALAAAHPKALALFARETCDLWLELLHGGGVNDHSKLFLGKIRQVPLLKTWLTFVEPTCVSSVSPGAHWWCPSFLWQLETPHHQLPFGPWTNNHVSTWISCQAWCTTLQQLHSKFHWH